MICIQLYPRVSDGIIVRLMGPDHLSIKKPLCLSGVNYSLVTRIYTLLILVVYVLSLDGRYMYHREGLGIGIVTTIVSHIGECQMLL